jgi:membrane protein YqaA with SNARE-associated domain
VLTGGCAYLAHAIAVAERNRGLLGLFWTCTAVATIIILSPEIVAAIPETHLSHVLASSGMKWTFRESKTPIP